MLSHSGLWSNSSVPSSPVLTSRAPVTVGSGVQPMYVCHGVTGAARSWSGKETVRRPSEEGL
jgi:hypothetical protein